MIKLHLRNKRLSRGQFEQLLSICEMIEVVKHYHFSTGRPRVKSIVAECKSITTEQIEFLKSKGIKF